MERCFNLHRITIETAGQSGPNAGPEFSQVRPMNE
jgi:hypothetical protein